MELEIFWSQIAEDKLQDIFNYYKQKEGIRTANKIITKIINKTSNLTKHPQIGTIEELLVVRLHEFRYLVSNNFKIIYYINYETRRIIIAKVFDTRQNPDKLQETRI